VTKATLPMLPSLFERSYGAWFDINTDFPAWTRGGTRH
jgi:hypothetical protein